jgi:hypothetical protein
LEDTLWWDSSDSTQWDDTERWNDEDEDEYQYEDDDDDDDEYQYEDDDDYWSWGYLALANLAGDGKDGEGAINGGVVIPCAILSFALLAFVCSRRKGLDADDDYQRSTRV